MNSGSSDRDFPPCQVFTHDQTVEHIWGDDFIDDSNIIEVYVRYLRIELEEKGSGGLFMQCVGFSYALRE